MKIIITFFLLLMVVQGNLKAQTPEGSTSDFSYFLGDLSYINDAVFMGRRDSIAAPYAYASMGYFDKSGFYGNASASYLVSSAEERFDLFLISAGYLLTNKNFTVGISGTKYFFDDESYNVLSEIEGDITGLVSYDFRVTELTLSGASYFSSSSSPDFTVNLMIDRNFYAINKKLVISPALILSAGTQYFYEEYYNTSRLGNRKGGGSEQQGPGNGPGGPAMMQSEVINVSISEASEFNILNIEAQLPLQYYYKSFIFSFTPMVSFPQTSATITTESAVYKEDLESVFYWSAGISYWIQSGK
ncbi:hypothetical protein [Salinimicrobium sediminilitoris]|uniref:hypothetical protein n=1 Tax=Salinimicrobium sediminilitoris TaxID=2876715 RepID=UPI001E34B92E|nr:hypothetical protein [Salinimicrobium sediminilitoris]MCC8358715.1 hypothetical protein [Salinimicrobium sediminilitoris]